jgi:hypothetical protein
VDAHNLAANAAILAVAAFAVADRDAPLAPHSDRATIVRLLEKTRTDAFVKEMGWMK